MNILFPLGVRLSSLLTSIAFVGLAAAWRDRRLLVAGAAWFTGYEVAFETASIATDKLPLGLPGPIFFIVLGLVTLIWAHRQRVRPDWRLIAAALVVMSVWVGTGFYRNGHQHGFFSFHTRIAHFDPWAEVLNEVSKTLWALAYFLPLLRSHGVAGVRTSRREDLSRAGGVERAPTPLSLERGD